MIFDWCFKCDTKHDLDEPCEGIMNTITTNTEATAQLYRANPSKEYNRIHTARRVHIVENKPT